MQEKNLKLIQELDQIYADILAGKQDIESRLNEIIASSTSLTNNEATDELTNLIISNFNQKVNLIYKIYNPAPQNISLDELREKFKVLEFKQYQISNNFVMGSLKYSEIEEFQKLLFSLRKELYAIPISDTNLLEIAKMKSKIQHYETEILEDEEVLRVAYENSN